MPRISFKELWDNHPYPNNPCDTTHFTNQCAIRMGVALDKSGVNMDSFNGAKCYPGFKHNPKHILRAQELANWLKNQKAIVGKVKTYRNVTSADFKKKKGIVFIKNGWGATDHIDVWDGKKMKMKGGSPSYFSLGKEVWFWELK
jgi:hypothetical protein